MDTLEKQLDIHSLIKMHLNFRVFLRRSLTPQQRVLLRYQRERLPALDASSPSETDGLDLSEPYDSYQVKRFTGKTLLGFAVKTELDRRLL